MRAVSVGGAGQLAPGPHARTRACCTYRVPWHRTAGGDWDDEFGGEAQFHPLYKTQWCSSFLSPEGCRFGDQCNFAHSAEELRRVWVGLLKREEGGEGGEGGGEGGSPTPSLPPPSPPCPLPPLSPLTLTPHPTLPLTPSPCPPSPAGRRRRRTSPPVPRGGTAGPSAGTSLGEPASGVTSALSRMRQATQGSNLG